MDFLKNAVGGDNNANQNQNDNQQGGSGGEKKEGGGGFLSGLGDKINGAAGGGKESEKNEDYLDKGIDMVQEKFMGAGPQDNESAVEQAKDEQISDFIRGQYKSTTGSDMPIKDKPTSLDRNTD
ncbi:related to DNA damage-responsive protein 48 [Ramularia collo-cygni]|uniref:Related to DNA damage-responsive protein 48 n=1 Tax=Ramularia collo-cygni TaxID=112498 RepID=A0A2D3V6F3_9PEZI|nr:related to DNA damage-responsive protein 48 [Ramularia collo-cygni]CZT18104.1 related to DNA damage-responsive protein 48 [Ramularia collo-cygni]